MLVFSLFYKGSDKSDGKIPREREKGKLAADGQSDITSYWSCVPLHQNGCGWEGLLWKGAGHFETFMMTLFTIDAGTPTHS